MFSESFGHLESVADSIASLRELLSDEKNLDALVKINDRAVQLKKQAIELLTGEPFNLDVPTAETVLISTQEWPALINAHSKFHTAPNDSTHASARILVSRFLSLEIQKLIKEVEEV